MKQASSPSKRIPTLAESLVPVACLMVFLGAAVINVDELPTLPVITAWFNALAAIPYFGGVLHASIPVQLPLVGATLVAALLAWRQGWSWAEIEASFLDGIRLSLGAVLILLVVGMLIGTWIASGVVPLMIVYGLKLLSPHLFLFAACLICAIVSLATGSSWTTAGTVGIAFMGIGTGLGVPLPMVAGAIVSGAYFGDKMSPLSDTTNLAPAVAGSELFEHVRHMVYTTAPSFVMALGLYWLLGLHYGGEPVQLDSVHRIVNGLTQSYVITPWLLLAPVLVIAMVVGRIPALPALLVGTLVGGIFASVVQGVPLARLLGIAYHGFVGETGVKAVDELLTRGGMASMYGTIGIIICAMCFGGVMERSGMLGRIAAAILHLAHGTPGLILATLATCVGTNIVAPDQYLSIVVPGRMYRNAYRKAGLQPKNLSRCLEDAGTMTSPLVPWNSCGAYMFATLGVLPFAYLPFAFFNLINPLVSALYGLTGWTIARLPPDPSPPAPGADG